MNVRATIEDSPEHGPVWRTADAELADLFEDFLTERCFALFRTRFQGDEVLLFFGRAASAEKVRELYDQFLREELG